MKVMQMKWAARMGVAGAGLVLLLTGCANYVTTNVTAFQNWSGRDADRTYTFLRSAAQNNLEQSSYEQLVDNELSTYGFRQVAPPQAHYGVALAYGVRNETVVVPQPIYYDPWPAPGWRGWYGPVPFGPVGPVGYVNQTYLVFVKFLSIRIVDQTSHAEVYNVTANTSDSDSALLPAMPYLVRSALHGFPLPNGTITQVRLPVNPRGGATSINTNERALAPAVPATAPASPPK
jgi:Domain of unknown function (DUF4136)